MVPGNKEPTGNIDHGEWVILEGEEHALREGARAPQVTVARRGGPGFLITALIVVLLVLQQIFLTPAQLRAWGWRIPFLIGALLAVTALAMRRNLHETDDFIAAKSMKRFTLAAFTGAPAHSSPAALPGLIHDVSAIAEAGLRFITRFDSINRPGCSSPSGNG